MAGQSVKSGYRRSVDLARFLAAFGCARFFGSCVLRRLRCLGGKDFSATLFVDSQDRRGNAGEAATRECGFEGCGVFADSADVVHGAASFREGMGWLMTDLREKGKSEQGVGRLLVF